MKLISLNIEHGANIRKLVDFIKKQSETTDIFVFQEMDEPTSSGPTKAPGGVLGNNITLPAAYSTISNVLSDFVPYRSKPYVSLGSFLAIFVKRGLEIDGRRERVLTKTVELFGLNSRSRLLCIRVHKGDKSFWVCNTHGVLIPGKWREDTAERLLQSRMILNTLSEFEEPKLLCGDFNLPPHTKTMELLEKNMDNLIVRYKIKNTRSRLYLKNAKYANGAEITDHILISRDVKATGFKVLDTNVSDHLPLILNFSVV